MLSYCLLGSRSSYPFPGVALSSAFKTSAARASRFSILLSRYVFVRVLNRGLPTFVFSPSGDLTFVRCSSVRLSRIELSRGRYLILCSWPLYGSFRGVLR